MAFRLQLFDLAREIVLEDQIQDCILARTLNIGRTRASALIHGHIRLFNSETLVDILARLGVTVEVTVVKRQRYYRGYARKARPGWKLAPNTVMW